jgi:CheY-like chemotaxis protein
MMASADPSYPASSVARIHAYSPTPTPRPVPAVEPVVLLVDDHPLCLRNLCLLVESAGYDCAAAASPAAALSFCEARHPALVVTDLAMPRLDGHGLARTLKARYPSMPILLLTGEPIPPSAHAVLDRTFHAVLSKPLEVAPFLTILGELMPPPARATPPSL